jgi:hypothetical protein
MRLGFIEKANKHYGGTFSKELTKPGITTVVSPASPTQTQISSQDALLLRF